MDVAQFEQRIEKEPWGCWTWLRFVNKDGYGVLRVRGQEWKAHRYSYELYVGPIAEGLTIDHICRNRACVNPYHLRPVTIRENVLASTSPGAKNARKTHCHRGHEFDEDNTLWIRGGTARVCRECRRLKLKHTKRGPEPKTHCKRGHAFTPENTYVSPSGVRACRTCKRDQAREKKRAEGAIPWADRRAAQTHCKHGHAYTEENTYWFERDGKRYRYCRTCARERVKAHRTA